MPDVRKLLEEAVGRFEPTGELGNVERRVERRRRVQRLTAGVVALGLFALVAVVAWTTLRQPAGPTPGATTSPPPTTSPTPTSTPTPSPTSTMPAESVALGRLPQRGVAVQSGDTVRLIGLDGSVLATLDGYSLAGNPGADGVWLEREGQIYSLSIRPGALIPVSDEQARDLDLDEGPALSYPPAPGATVGHWRYSIASSSVTTAAPGATLAQWSGECEVPTAYWVEGSQTRILTGEGDPAAAPASIALGWTEDGEAIALVFGSSCGGDAPRPGIYLFSAPGDGRLLVQTPDEPVAADAWGTGL